MDDVAPPSVSCSRCCPTRFERERSGRTDEAILLHPRTDMFADDNEVYERSQLVSASAVDGVVFGVVGHHLFQCSPSNDNFSKIYRQCSTLSYPAESTRVCRQSSLRVDWIGRLDEAYRIPRRRWQVPDFFVVVVLNQEVQVDVARNSTTSTDLFL